MKSLETKTKRLGKSAANRERKKETYTPKGATSSLHYIVASKIPRASNFGGCIFQARTLDALYLYLSWVKEGKRWGRGASTVLFDMAFYWPAAAAASFIVECFHTDFPEAFFIHFQRIGSYIDIYLASWSLFFSKFTMLVKFFNLRLLIIQTNIFFFNIRTKQKIRYRKVSSCDSQFFIGYYVNLCKISTKRKKKESHTLYYTS